MPRFVILEHDHPLLHWDFMLEAGAALMTWRLARPPQVPGEVIEALPLGDHRLAYLEYEGPVSADRGTVKRWDWGSYEPLTMDEGRTFRVRLAGERVQGVAVLEKGPAGWTLRLGE